MALATKETIFAAADALAAKGASVTQNAIRQELGGGSFTTISEFLQEWRKTRPRETAIESMRQGLGDRLEASRFNAASFTTPSENNANAKASSEGSALALAKQQLAAAEARADAQADAIKILREDHQAAQAEIIRLAVALGAAQERAAAAERRASFYALELAQQNVGSAREGQAGKG